MLNIREADVSERFETVLKRNMLDMLLVTYTVVFQFSLRVFFTNLLAEVGQSCCFAQVTSKSLFHLFKLMGGQFYISEKHSRWHKSEVSVIRLTQSSTTLKTHEDLMLV